MGRGEERAGNGILRCTNFQRWEEEEEEEGEAALIVK